MASTSKQPTKPPEYIKLFDLLDNEWLYEESDGIWRKVKQYHDIRAEELAVLERGEKCHVCLPRGHDLPDNYLPLSMYV